MWQLLALLHKNWILCKRNKLGSILQIILPILFLLFTMLTRNLAQINTYAAQSNLSNNSLVFNFYGDPIAASSTLSVSTPTFLKNCGDKVVALVPTGNSLVNQLQTILVGLGYTVQKYADDAQVDAIVRDPGYGITYSLICFGVSFENVGKTYNYNLRFNISKQQLPRPDLKLSLDQNFNPSYYYQPLVSGALGLTTIINNLILQAQLGITSTMLTNKQGIIYQQQSFYDPIFMYLGGSFEFINLLPLLIIYLRQTSFMLQEKQKKIRENLLISGMGLGYYYGAWFIRFFLTFGTVHGVCTFIICYCFPRIPWYIPLILYLLFDIVLLIQSFLIQIFVTRSKIGIILALVFFILQYSANYAISNNANANEQIYNLLSIIPHVAYVLAFKNIIYADSYQIQPTFTTLLYQYQLQTSVISLAVNIGVWLILLWYLDQVVPNQWGAKKGICFCLEVPKQRSLGRSEMNQSRIESTNMKIIPEQTSIYPIKEQEQAKYKKQEEENKTIKLINLNKNYDQLHAVKDLNLTIYSDQIFVLLGHNGAGKTSLLSMLTGMTEPSSGSMEVLGLTDLSQWRQKLGLCPQHDTLYDQLTVEQHLFMFATLRGLKGQLLENEVNNLIKAVNLEEKRQQYSKNLSGGQKRKLSVALAFSGGSKVIILDEPTSGMDTSARRYIWEMLKNYKNGRIIILTTHFMDEADYLGDRIGVMAAGRLLAVGSPLFLKNRFGVGYNLTIVKTSSSVNSIPIIKAIETVIPEAKIITNVSSQISAQLPLQRVKHFSRLFGDLDSRKKQLGLQTYGVSITTLQQVFLRIGEQEDQNQEQNKRKQKIAKLKMGSRIDEEMVQQIVEQRSNVRRSGKPIQNSDINGSIMMSRSTVLKKEMDILGQEQWEREDQCLERFMSHLAATILKRLRVIRRDIKSFLFELILPMVIFIIAMFLMRISFVKDFSSMDLSYDVYLSQSNPVVIPIGADSANSALLNSLANNMNIIRGSNLQIKKYLASSDILFDSQYLLQLKKQNSKLRGGIYFNPSSTSSGITILPFTSIMNTRSPTSCISVQALAAETYINQVSGQGVKIKPISKPLPMTQSQLQVNNAISGFFGALIFSIALAFKFASIVSFIVKQREDSCKHQQIVSGLHLGSYWIGNYLYDFGLYAIIAVFSLAMCKVFEIKALVQDGAFLATCLLFALFGFTNVTLTYIMSFVFKDYGNAQGVVYFFNFVAGGIAPIIVLVLRWIGESSNSIGRALAWILRVIPAFSFGQGLLNLSSLSILSGAQNRSPTYIPMDLQIALAPILYIGILGIILIIVLIWIEYIITNETCMRRLSSENNCQESTEVNESDVLNQQKRALAANPDDYQILTKNLRKVYILDSDKKYKVAVDNLSFGVEKGEVFGLLGVNGAGKSTTFKMLAGEIVSTSGDCYFTGLKVSENLPEIRKNLGYCPQFDALIENLTVRQQLQLYYDMKCLPKRFKKIAIDQIINQLDLTIHQQKLSGTLSGGNKRKLSVGLAIIGNPSIVFLDEPSTGMDPKARRFMWKLISKIATQRKQSTIILTTHSMQQAQALSTRLAIMVKGNFKCVGPPQYIKSKYGKGFQIQIKIKPIQQIEIKNERLSHNMQNSQVNFNNLQMVIRNLKYGEHVLKEISKNGKGRYLWNQIQGGSGSCVDDVVKFVMLRRRLEGLGKVLVKGLGEIEQIQSLGTYIRYKTKQSISISKVFQLLQQTKNQQQISEYSIKQSSVQQIFNKFAAEDGNNDQS